MEIRAEQPADRAAVYRVNVAAFGREGEAKLVDQLRDIASRFSFVAVDSDHIVGHIFYSPVQLIGTEANPGLILGLAPVAVLPSYQRQGIGSRLIEHSLDVCRRSLCQAVVVLGHPNYYPRFGFVPAQEKGLKCEYSVPEEAFMVLELQPRALAGCGGTVQYRPEFNQLE